MSVGFDRGFQVFKAQKSKVLLQDYIKVLQKQNMAKVCEGQTLLYHISSLKRLKTQSQGNIPQITIGKKNMKRATTEADQIQQQIKQKIRNKIKDIQYSKEVNLQVLGFLTNVQHQISGYIASIDKIQNENELFRKMLKERKLHQANTASQTEIILRKTENQQRVTTKNINKRQKLKKSKENQNYSHQDIRVIQNKQKNSNIRFF